MALDASTLLGAPQIAGVQVSPLGTYKKTVTGIRGGAPGIMAGSLVWRFLLRKKLAEEKQVAATSDAPDIGNRAYAAVTADEFALVRVDTGTRVRLTEVISTIPRSDVVSAELDKGNAPGASLPLTITLADGRRWIFEVARLNRGGGEKLVGALGQPM
jgi:hypothetical protein